MSEAAANAGLAPASDSVQPSASLDDPANLNFGEPDEDQANAVVEEEQGSAAEPGEADEGQEPGDSDPADDDATDPDETGEDGNSSNPEPKDDVSVTVNGEAVPLSELKLGYMREKDYRHKTQDLGTRRRDLEALSARVSKSVDAIAEHLVKQIPPAPDPSLAMTNPGQYVQAKAVHDAAVQSVNALLSNVTDVKTVETEMTAHQRADLIAEENARLAEAFPQTASKAGRDAFFNEAATAARELGYSEEEIKLVTDHRMFKLAHYARLGLRAEQAQAKAKQKVVNAPPVAPAKRQPGANAAQRNRNAEAVKRLNRTGSLHDAMHVDFD